MRESIVKFNGQNFNYKIEKIITNRGAGVNKSRCIEYNIEDDSYSKNDYYIDYFFIKNNKFCILNTANKKILFRRDISKFDIFSNKSCIYEILNKYHSYDFVIQNYKKITCSQAEDQLEKVSHNKWDHIEKGNVVNLDSFSYLTNNIISSSIYQCSRVSYYYDWYYDTFSYKYKRGFIARSEVSIKFLMLLRGFNNFNYKNDKSCELLGLFIEASFIYHSNMRNILYEVCDTILLIYTSIDQDKMQMEFIKNVINNHLSQNTVNIINTFSNKYLYLNENDKIKNLFLDVNLKSYNRYFIPCRSNYFFKDPLDDAIEPYKKLKEKRTDDKFVSGDSDEPVEGLYQEDQIDKTDSIYTHSESDVVNNDSSKEASTNTEPNPLSQNQAPIVNNITYNYYNNITNNITNNYYINDPETIKFIAETYQIKIKYVENMNINRRSYYQINDFLKQSDIFDSETSMQLNFLSAKMDEDEFNAFEKKIYEIYNDECGNYLDF